MIIYVVCAALGCAAGARLRWPGLVVAAILVSVASGLLGVLTGIPGRAVLAQMGLSVMALEAGYAATLVVMTVISRHPALQAWLGSGRRDKLDGTRASNPRRS